VYQDALTECARVLRPKGRLIFKQQDLTDKYTYWVHIDVYQWALARGFRAIDHIIRIVERGRAWNPEKRQLDSRKFHSDFWVFEKKSNRRSALSTAHRDGDDRLSDSRGALPPLQQDSPPRPRSRGRGGYRDHPRAAHAPAAGC
jgi:hypothetical protein